MEERRHKKKNASLKATKISNDNMKKMVEWSTEALRADGQWKVQETWPTSMTSMVLFFVFCRLCSAIVGMKILSLRKLAMSQANRAETEYLDKKIDHSLPL